MPEWLSGMTRNHVGSARAGFWHGGLSSKMLLSNFQSSSWDQSGSAEGAA
ncbi:hypothetical protein CCACVL1_22700 [Corchorus capsularis]|uniref:Uncharacterized protein n=1 Tax=Corchorus capsularis TaxID=210143 RepID=A0A1R3GX54_COCAP|nr:hypothetical protein CCACVL1_22700 [Corchorus capsularis]